MPTSHASLSSVCHCLLQANLNTDTGSTGVFGQPASLLMLWVERVVEEHKSYTNWPLLRCGVVELDA